MPRRRTPWPPPIVTPQGMALQSVLGAHWSHLDALAGTDAYPDRFIDHTETRALLAGWMAGARELHQPGPRPHHGMSIRKKAA